MIERVIEAAGIRRLIERHASLAAVAVRLAYGTRIAGPMLIGASSMPQLRFAVPNALSAVARALLVGAAGWLFSEAAQTIFGHRAHAEGWLDAQAATECSIRKLRVKNRKEAGGAFAYRKPTVFRI
jgi:membrane protein DedA with SNARE-associated domain